MASQVQRLKKLGLLNSGAPHWIADNCMYEAMVGSVAYGVSTDMSDMDIYGWTIPPKELVFTHLAGNIDGFGKQKQRFDVYQEHHLKDSSVGRQYDISVYSIVRYFHLCMENNPNMVGSLFVPQRCILHMTPVAQMVRERRREFLHKGSFHKFKGYAYASLNKIDGSNVYRFVTFCRDRKVSTRTTLEQVRNEIEKRKAIPRTI